MNSRSAGTQRILIPVALLLLVFAVYGRSGSHAFIDFDDSEYVYDNPVVQRGLSLPGVVWAFAFTSYAHWHPLTWLSHMTDVAMFGLNPGWHHLMSVFLHGLNAVLLFLVLRRMTGAVWRSALVSALFAIHPLHVESVAWVAERKDVLSTSFWLLTMAAYARYVQSPDLPRYLVVVIVFALGLLSKPMLVSLPLVLLLLDLWPLGRLTEPAPPTEGPRPILWARVPQLAREKLILFGLAAVSSIITYKAQAGWGAAWSGEALPLTERISNAIVSYAVYLVKTVYPVSLAVFYPHPASVGRSMPTAQVVAAMSIVAALSAVALGQARRRPYVTVGWLWYVISLLPVIGLVQIGSQAMADRYTYVPLIGVFIVLSWGVTGMLERFQLVQRLATVLWAAVIVVLSGMAWVQVGYWRDSATLYAHAIEVTESNWLAWNNLGVQHLNAKRPGDALECFRRATQIKPDYADAWYNAGVALTRLGQHPLAVVSYKESLRLEPVNADGWVNLGTAHEALGQHAEAVVALQAALRLRPDDPLALYSLALAHAAQGDPASALAASQRLRALDPVRAHELMRRIFGASPGASRR